MERFAATYVVFWALRAHTICLVQHHSRHGAAKKTGVGTAIETDMMPNSQLKLLQETTGSFKYATGAISHFSLEIFVPTSNRQGAQPLVSQFTIYRMLRARRDHGKAFFPADSTKCTLVSRSPATTTLDALQIADHSEDRASTEDGRLFHNQFFDGLERTQNNYGLANNVKMHNIA